MEKLFKLSNDFFYHNDFYHSREAPFWLFLCFDCICKFFEIGRVQILSFGNGFADLLCLHTNLSSFNFLPNDKYWTVLYWKSSQTTNNEFKEIWNSFSSRVEMILRKVVVAHIQEFLLFPQLFHDLSCYKFENLYSSIS